jgi:hypothetical protein
MSTHLRHDLRSLALHQEAVRVRHEHPEKASRALEVLTRWKAKGDVHTMPLWDEWRRIIEGQLWELAVQENDRGQQLHQARSASSSVMKSAPKSWSDSGAALARRTGALGRCAPGARHGERSCRS